MSTMLAERPAHVPPELMVDFDFFALGDRPEGVQLAFMDLHKGPDIVWTPHHGGHWIATRYEDIDAIQRDHIHFSHKHFTIPRNDYDPGAIPLGLDPPQHTPFRKLLMQAFTPKAVKMLGDIARDTARELIAEIAPRGRCEFVGDFAKVLPIHVFLGMVNLPISDKHYLLPLAEIAVRSSNLAEKLEAQGKMHTYLEHYVDERITNPGDDLLSMITQGDIDGRPITRDESIRMAGLVMGGGLDTVASSLGFIAQFLATHPTHRADLVANPQLNPVACEELLRRFGLPNTSRMLTMDYEYKGIQFRKDDLILTPKCLAGLDDRVVENPAEVNFRRKPSTIKHSAFGSGPHICPGAVLARREIMVFLDEWLPVIPDFEIDPDDEVIIASGSVSGVLRLPLRWAV
jgi:cytochrome P450